EAGAPVAGAETTLSVKRSDSGMVIRMGPEPPAPRAVTSSRGTFRISPVDPRKGYDLKTAAAGFAPSSREIVGLEPKRTMAGVRIELGRGRVVMGQVVDADGRPIRDADAVLRPAKRSRV